MDPVVDQLNAEALIITGSSKVREALDLNEVMTKIQALPDLVTMGRDVVETRAILIIATDIIMEDGLKLPSIRPTIVLTSSSTTSNYFQRLDRKRITSLLVQ
jgi:hypothetical protein